MNRWSTSDVEPKKMKKRERRKMSEKNTGKKKRRNRAQRIRMKYNILRAIFLFPLIQGTWILYGN